ncbi:carboxypeptidase-like regulatory domain-containing protein [Delftia tsuruhatensis]|uniref:Carboxypeptidase-like regulatory domain-containing protein n=1 Tax=Delftia tsuruhatensis TaxID=180282 RepID=A0AAX3SJH5_9BURK|nr:carboxypeptidase-like regulatory domain-containing protein [Delftia tsuruhatensis]WFF80130.1 carboxypeptidase-like regulatory domain-containing protein [Delftia tsuruhatensis]
MTALARMAGVVKAWLAACLALALLLVSPAWAQTTLSGTISSPTILRASQSPYLMQGDVVLDGDATLTIEPGVTLRMAPGASFLLRKGALQAVGTPDKPILITSAATTPAPGDWRQWRMTAGTRSAQTLLDHVTIEYGSGVVIENAAPSINNTAFNHHSGPAIGVDLASSPAGKGNSAKGNSLNAIAVPSGTIRSQVIWGMVGIPYLVQQGLIQIGQAPLSIEPAKLRLSPGVVAMLRVSLNAPAPAQGVVVDIISSVPSVASAVARVTVAPGQTSADLEVQASTLGATRITASHATLGLAETQIEVVNLPSLGLVPGSPTVGVNRPYPMTVSLPAPAPVGGVNVQLGNSDANVLSVPSSVLVPAGQQGASFEVMGLADGSSRLTAQAEGHASALATVSVRGKALVLPASVIVAPGAQAAVTLETTEPAPSAGLAVSLALEQAGLAQVPASVQIPSGQSKAAFTVAGQSLGTTRITATASGYQSAQAALRVDAIGLNTDPSADLVMNEELSKVLRVQLNKAAPQGGVTVSVASRDPAVASVSPAEVLIPQGQIYATTPITVKALAVGETALDITSAGLIAKAVKVNVRAKFALKLTRYGGDKLIVGKGLYSYYNELYVERLINGVVSNGADAVTVNLRCVAAEICETPATVTIPAGQSRAYINVGGLELGSTQIEATAEGATAAMPVPVEVIAPQVRIEGLDGQRSTSSLRDSFYVVLSVPGAYWSDSQNATQPMTVQVSLVDQSPAGVVGGIYTAADGGALVSQLVIGKDRRDTGWGYIERPGAAGTYRVLAQVQGLAEGKSNVQTVVAANQALKLTRYGGDKLIVGKGLYSYYNELYVERLINGVVSNGADAVTVNLRCVAAEICETPATVTIPAGQSRAYINVGGLELGSTQIEATAEGATAAMPVPVEVIAPQVRIEGLDGQRSTSSLRDSFYVVLSVPGAYWSDSQNATQPMTVQVSLVDQSPAGVVGGIYTAADGGALVSQLVIGKDRRDTGWGYIERPGAAGTYRVLAQVQGLAEGKSNVQTVVAANQALKLTRYGGDKLIVGKGLYSYYNELYVERLINGVVSNGADAVTVNLRCVAAEICETPATVTIPAGQNRAYINVGGLELGSTQIEATAEGATAAMPVPVEVIAPQVRIEGLDGQRSTSSLRDSFYVVLSVPGAYWSDSQNATQPMTVQVSLVDQSPAGVVGGIYTAADGGALVSQLVIGKDRRDTGWGYIERPGAAGTYRVLAQVQGLAEGKSNVQTVVAANQALKLTRYGGDKLIVGKGLYSYYNELYVERLINGVVSNGADAVTVNLRCVAAEICETPATVTIPAGQSRAYINVGGLELGSTQIEASAAGMDSIYINVETVAPTLRLQSVPASLKAGQKANSIYVSAEVPGAYWSTSQYPSNPLTITFTSSVPSIGNVTDTVTWNANTGSSTYATFTAVAPGTTQITASSPGFTPATSASITVYP